MATNKYEFTTERAAQYIRNYLKRHGLTYRHSLISLLEENRRSPTLKTRTGKTQERGNRHRFGVIPFEYKGIIAFYSRRDLSQFIESTLIPTITGTAK